LSDTFKLVGTLVLSFVSYILLVVTFVLSRVTHLLLTGTSVLSCVSHLMCIGTCVLYNEIWYLRVRWCFLASHT